MHVASLLPLRRRVASPQVRAVLSRPKQTPHADHLIVVGDVHKTYAQPDPGERRGVKGFRSGAQRASGRRP